MNAVSEERSTQNPFFNGSDLPECGVAATVEHGGPRLKPLHAQDVDAKSTTIRAPSTKTPVPQKSEPMANPHSALAKLGSS